MSSNYLYISISGRHSFWQSTTNLVLVHGMFAKMPLCIFLPRTPGFKSEFSIETEIGA